MIQPSDTYEWFDHASNCKVCEKHLNPDLENTKCVIGKPLQEAARIEWANDPAT